MFEFIRRWYRKQFSDPQAVSLAVTLLVVFGVIYFWGNVLMPFLVAVVFAYLLDWPIVRLEKIGLSRLLAVILALLVFVGVMLLALLVFIPTVWQQGLNLLRDTPDMINRLHTFLTELPARYPTIIDAEIVEAISQNTRARLMNWGEGILSQSLGTLVSIATLAIYLILVPLMVFFMLKDKKQMLLAVKRMLPRNRLLLHRVAEEMNHQIANYIRGKAVEIVIVGVATWLVFAAFQMQYAALLAALVGLSVVVPYVGAVLVTIPVVLVGLYQWGLGPDFWAVIIAYLVVQGVDGNIVVPFLFSEAVNLHPLVIILSVIVFGSLWGFWGVFFAIPLATLFKAVYNAWPKESAV